MSAALPDVDLVVFDLDGTLADSRGDLAAAVNHARAELGLPPHDLDTVTGFVGDGVGALIDRAFRKCDDAGRVRALDAFSSHYAAHSGVHTRLFPGVADLLAGLAGRGSAVVTNKAERFVGPLLDHLGIGAHFDLVVGERPDLARKPAPDMVLHVLAALDVDPGRAVMVGDAEQDLAAGRSAGLRVVHVTWGYGGERAMRGPDPDLRIDHPLDLLPALGPSAHER